MLTTLGNLVRRLSITDTSLYPLLSQLLVGADAWAKSYLRYDPEFQATTEYYSGGNGLIVLLKRFPVSRTPAPRVWFDATGYFGDGPNAFASTTELVLGTNFVVEREADGVCQSGSLRWLTGDGITAWGGWGWGIDYGGVYNSYWPYGWPACRGAIKVTYSAGWAEDDIPWDMSEAVEIKAAYEYGVRLAAGTGSGTVKSEKWDLWATTYMTPVETNPILAAAAKRSSASPQIAEAQSLLDPYRDWSCNR